MLRQARDNRRKLVAGALIAPIFLRDCSQVGKMPCTLGAPILTNYGNCRFGDRLLIISQPVKVSITVDDGAQFVCGNDAFLNYGVCIEATHSIRIGDRCLIGPMSNIIDNDFHGLYERYRRPEPKAVNIGDDVWLGRGVSVLPGVNIGNGAVVASGSVVTKDVEAFTVVAGVPAKKIKVLNPDEFISKSFE